MNNHLRSCCSLYGLLETATLLASDADNCGFADASVFVCSLTALIKPVWLKTNNWVVAQSHVDSLTCGVSLESGVSRGQHFMVMAFWVSPAGRDMRKKKILVALLLTVITFLSFII